MTNETRKYIEQLEPRFRSAYIIGYIKGTLRDKSLTDAEKLKDIQETMRVDEEISELELAMAKKGNYHG